MSSLTRRACYKCGNVGHYAGTVDNTAILRLWDTHILQRCALPRNACAITVRGTILYFPLVILIYFIGKQPGMKRHEPLLVS